MTQKEYFQFRAFFEPLEIRHERIPGEPDPGVYPKYSYGASYAPIRSGAVRIFDEKPDAKTWMYSRGDERDRLPGKPPVKPGAPAFIGGDKLNIRPVDLPPEVAYPGLLPFVQQEEEQARLKVMHAGRDLLDAARRQRETLEKQAAAPEAYAKVAAKLRLARAAEAIRTAELAAAEAEWQGVRARVAADKAKYGKAAGDREALARAAARAEKFAAYQTAVAKLTQQEQNLLVYAADGPAAELAKTEKLVADLRKVADTARAAVAKAGNAYTSIGPTYPARSSGRRLALARWVTSPDNPLTPRVAANYVWGWHFGSPLVGTTANFGRQGTKPTHPELLDWLASELLAQGWRLKPIHRLLVTSESYRMASQHPDDSANRSRDPDNHYVWRYPTQRLEAEVVRDAVLHSAGELDRAVGGKEVDQSLGLTVPRRSLYFSHHGETREPFLDLFDAANPCDCYRRSDSVRPQQALAMANSELNLRMARRLADKLTTPDDKAFITAAFEQVLSRPPAADEAAAAASFLSRQVKLFRSTPLPPAAGAAPGEVPSADPARRARENLVHALYNHTDFVTLR